MADFIQSEIKVIHSVENSKPTETNKPTAPKLSGTDEEEKSPNSPKVDSEVKDSVLSKKIINASVMRRTGNLVIKNVESEVNRHFDRRIFNASFAGNNRKASKIQNEKAVINNITNKVKSTSGALITAVSLGGAVGLAIVAVQSVTMISDYANELQNFRMQMEQYNANRDKEIFKSRYSQSRLVWNNRRR